MIKSINVMNFKKNNIVLSLSIHFNSFGTVVSDICH